MNVSTITISREEAERKLEQYKSVQGRKRLAEDDKLQSLYAAVSKGARVINIGTAFKSVGLNDRHEPKLGIARADWKEVSCFRGSSQKSVVFGPDLRLNKRTTALNIRLPIGTYDWKQNQVRVNDSYSYWTDAVNWHQLRTAVPHVPPSVRPRFGLHNYHILFEVKEWKAYNVDPFLLRRIAGHLYVVEAEWELTELEAALLSGMTGN